MELTVNEAALLAGVSPRRIEKAAEEGVFEKHMAKEWLHARKAAHVPAQTVLYLAIVDHMPDLHLGLGMKQRLFTCLRDIENEDDGLNPFEVMPGVSFSIVTLAGVEWGRTCRYLKYREEHLEARADILGGEPVIKGTRITCRSVLGRLEDGDTLEDLGADYPEIPLAAFEAAATYARAHPPRGRPSQGKPWRQ